MKSSMFTAQQAPADVGFTRDELESRVDRVKSAMEADGLDLLVVTEQSDIHFLTGARDLLGTLPMVLIVPREGTFTLVTRSVDAQAYRPQIFESHIVEYNDHEPPTAAIAAGIHRYEIHQPRVGMSFQGHALSAQTVDELCSALTDCEWTDSSRLVWDICALKSESELAHMRDAAAVNDTALRHALATMGPGVADNEVAASLVSGMLSAGSHMTPGYYQVVAGERTLTAHATHNGSLLAQRDHVLFEFSSSRYRYNAPLMRTATVGAVVPGLQRMHDAAVDALEAAIAAMRPGVTSGDVHESANAALDRHHMRHLRPHRTGYMVGASSGSTSGGWPQGQIMNLRAGDQNVLQKNMTFHLPLALYMEDLGTVGVSETVVVTESGGEALGRTPRQLLRSEEYFE